MTETTARRLAWSIWGVTLAFLPPIGLLIYLNRSMLSAKKGDSITIPALFLSILAYATVGALVAARHHRNPIGWGLGVVGLGLALAIFWSGYAARALVVAPGSLPNGSLAAWLQGWLGIPALSAITLVFLLFPTGSVASRRWRPVLWLATGAASLDTIAWALKPGPINQTFGNAGRLLDENPFGVGHVEGIVGGIVVASTLGAVLAGAAAIVSIVVRFGGATGEERQQIRWLALIGAVAATAFVVLLGVSATVCPGDSGGSCAVFGDITWTIFFLSLALGIPIACGIAILKYRLYDLDIVVKKTVVFALVAAFMTVVYVVIVIAVPTLIVGVGSGAGFSPLALVTTVIVAIAFQPVRTRARRVADRIVYGKRATPYEVLSDFAERAAGTYSSEDVLPRMVQILSAGTGATEARVWLRVGSSLRLAASWPVDGEGGGETLPLAGDLLPAFGGDRRAFPVRHHGELLGAITVVVPPSDPLTPAQEKLLTDLAAQTGLVLRNVRLIEELRASRRRIVTAQDERAKTLERNIHDGAQQQLVALSVKLRLAAQLADRDPAKARAMLDDLQAESADALENLRDLARGIYPPLLADKGLRAALEAQARKAPVPVTVETNEIGRYPQESEAAVYFCTLEALQNVAKYANASRVTVRLSSEDGRLSFAVVDDGTGFDPRQAAPGTGLQGMADRLDALGGTLDVQSAPGRGTTVLGSLPVVVTGAGNPG